MFPVAQHYRPRIASPLMATVLVGLVLLWLPPLRGAGAADELPAGVPAVETAEPAVRGPLPPTAGPDSLPGQQTGLWRVSLCAVHGHIWIRLADTASNRVLTLGRYRKGAGGRYDAKSGGWLVEPAASSGVQLNMEQCHEPAVLQGRHVLLTATVRNPKIFRGAGNGYGHGGLRNNCVTYARNAWHFYTGEWYDLPTVHTPKSLYRAISARYPPLP